jgi:hypothetical protein
MPSKATFGDSRRSTRVPLKVVIALEDDSGGRTCDGETIVVNVHGALIATAIGLRTGMRISVYVYLTDKRAGARVVYIDSKNPLHCGIELDKPRNIWGVPLPPDNWEQTAAYLDERASNDASADAPSLRWQPSSKTVL